MNSNTFKRILSAMVMVLIVGLALYLGQAMTQSFIALLGIISLDEILTNFSKLCRFSFKYLLNQALYLIFILILFVIKPNYSSLYFIYIASSINFIMFLFLLFTDKKYQIFKKILEKGANVFLYIFPSIFCVMFLASVEHWILYLILLSLIVFATDTGAWFFGKNFGKHKLWPSVSPKKTIEGLIGGVILSTIISSLFYGKFIGKILFSHIFIFAFLSLFSHFGDLLQSRIKREFNIKDSSNLIPGHGGLYDRIDSLLFLTPFFVLYLTKYLLK